MIFLTATLSALLAVSPERQSTRSPVPISALSLVRDLSDRVGPRPAGSPGDASARAWAKETMARLGFANVHGEPVELLAWSRGEAHAELVGAVTQPLRVAALGHSTATPKGGIVAELVEFSTLGELTAQPPGALAGKIVFMNVSTERKRDGSGYAASVAVRFQAPVLAAARGAQAVVITSIGTDQSRFPHTGVTESSKPEAPTVPSAALSKADAALVHRALEKGPARLRLDLSCGPEVPAQSENMVGEVRGTLRADEVVLLGAHLDSWDLGRGAIDDGAGVGLVLATAAGFVKSRPERTIRVVLFAGEETGAEGAKTYALAHAKEGPKLVVAAEADSGAGSVYAWRLKAATGGDGLRQRLTQALGALSVPFEQSAAHGGTDVQPLAALGVPFIDLAQDASDYFDHHHTENDVFERIVPEAYGQAENVFRSAVAVLASGAETLPRAPLDPSP